MASDLTSWMHSRLDEDGSLSDDAKLLILAALDGPQALADMAGYAAPPTSAEPGPAADPSGAFLKQIKVRGFRGIGPESQLDLLPAPSLTVICGRNGSGKSSFAEALELALTGTTFRWRDRPTQWKDLWRNVHVQESTRIDITLAEQSVGLTRLSVEWPDDSALDEAVTTMQRQGEKKQAGATALGWEGPMEVYRPLLTYEELGDLLTAEPKALYDALSTVLGLGQLASAVRELDDRRKATAAPETTMKVAKRTTTAALEDLDDERATEALALIAAKAPDTQAMRALASGTTGQAGGAAHVRALAALRLPSEVECHAASAELLASVADVAAAGVRVADHLALRMKLLDAAVAFHARAGDQPCPVCSGGVLDHQRSAAIREEIGRDGKDVAALGLATARLSAAENAARALLTPCPRSLAEPAPENIHKFALELAEHWTAWATPPTDPLELAVHLTTSAAPARAGLANLTMAADEFLGTLDEAWRNAAAHLASYANDVDAWTAAKAPSQAAAAAHKWLKANEIVLKNERVKPIEAEAKRIWTELKQQSNVDIGGITLESSNTRRHVEISARVDGEDAGALAVMSQGELHALALALFLPRATMPDSPFRFIVLDDPVQAMDPAKVDGLVRVLLRIAQTRQVIVFSHDDRFASAVRRAPKGIPVTVAEVTREAGSRVTAAVSLSPATRYLRDAFGLASDGGLPDETCRRVLPGLLRMALEAQARDNYFARALSSGAAPEDVESEWERNRTTRLRLALALDDPATIDRWLNNAKYRRGSLTKANRIHLMLDHGTPLDACRDTEKTLVDLREGKK